MNLIEISEQLSNFVRDETIQLIDLIFNDKEINNLYPGISDKKNIIIEKYFKNKLDNKTKTLNNNSENADCNRCHALLKNKKQCSNKKSKNCNYCNRHSKIRKFGEISLS